MTTLWCDIETFSTVDLKTCGSHRYAEEVEIMLFVCAFDNGPAQVIDLTDPMEPTSVGWIKHHMLKADTVVIHNSHFDRTMIRHAWGYDIPVGRIEDTMVMALAHGLPGGLDKLSEIFKLEEDKAKSKRGRELINLFCKPRPKNQKLRRATRETHPKEWEEFKEYARLDVEAMREVHKKLPRWNWTKAEQELWALDQRINDRGFAVDAELAERAVAAIDAAQSDLSRRASEATEGVVESATQRDTLLKYILEYYGVTLPDMQASTLERRLEDPELPQEVKDLIGIRLQATKSSTSKYKKLLNIVSSDRRMRACLQFRGAQRTGRFAGRFFQPQNLPRPNMEQEDIDAGIEAIKAGIADLLYDNVMSLTSNCIRGCIIAPPGRKLVASDLSNIEGRGGAWLAGEEWKLQAFREFDKGIGADLYKLAYAKAFQIDPKDVEKHQRQIGKVMELMLQYEGGVGAFITGAASYNIDLDAMAAIAWSTIPPMILKEALGAWEWAVKQRRTFGLDKLTYAVCDALKRMWRLAHPAISSYWKELDMAARRAILNPGERVPCRKVAFERRGNWLLMILPSGRALCYASPRIIDNKVTYMGVNQYTRQWSRIYMYGGKWLENATQAMSADVMTGNMPAIEAAGYDIILTVHDEVINEADDTPEFNDEHLSELLATTPWWAPDLPLAAGGFEAYRYRK